jgi:WD repeat-containing protein 1 (actin-interacting protein 1)
VLGNSLHLITKCFLLFIRCVDVAGNVRIWDTVGEEQILKSEIKAISGRITDIAWDSESKRIIAVGEGKER